MRHISRHSGAEDSFPTPNFRPLHVVSYSVPFEGEVTREELFNHLHVHPRLPIRFLLSINITTETGGYAAAKIKRMN